ncbi:hypothetical protein CC2G_002269 [Coprinopsis cinerea AmutBmut pab1-1]|nr:hypothetical protein CC2G_002269 [Coprinopsis cinerea AmutBmut pab1-1]
MTSQLYANDLDDSTSDESTLSEASDNEGQLHLDWCSRGLAIVWQRQGKHPSGSPSTSSGLPQLSTKRLKSSKADRVFFGSYEKRGTDKSPSSLTSWPRHFD